MEFVEVCFHFHFILQRHLGGFSRGALGEVLLTRVSTLLHHIFVSGAEDELLSGNVLVAHWRSCITAILNVGGPWKQKGHVPQDRKQK